MKAINQLIITIVLLVIIGIGAFLAIQQFKGKGKNRQAVFLTNGQVYFGNVSRMNSRWVRIKDIYYLQVQQPLQPPKDPKDQQQPQISLVKLGNELHGPKDTMDINRDQILFIEDMKDDSKVNGAIAEYIKTGGQSSQPAATPTVAPTK